MSDITQVIQQVFAGKADAIDDLLPLVYGELRRMAQQQLAKERPEHTFQPTDLLHEACLRLIETRNPCWKNRGHFFTAVAETMRRILIDHARRRRRLKRSSDRRVDMPLETIPMLQRPDELIALNDALSDLELLDQMKADVVKLKFFAGLTTIQVADALGVSTRTVERCWTYARVWLYRQMTESDK